MELAQRLQRLEDLEGIRHTFHDYCFSLDLADWGRLADVFTEDGTYEQLGLDGVQPGTDTIHRGREAIIAGYQFSNKGLLEPGVPGITYTGHIGANMQIDLDGDDATTLAYFFEIVGNDIVLAGTYQHRMRREPDRWRIAALRIAIRYQARMEASGFGGLPLPGILAKPF